jgi:hypothetical protein
VREEWQDRPVMLVSMPQLPLWPLTTCMRVGSADEGHVGPDPGGLDVVDQAMGAEAADLLVIS